MKKLLFVLAFAFIGQQAFSQMYIVVATDNNCTTPSLDDGYDLYIIDPTGNNTIKCITNGYEEINIELNNIISLGYKLIHIQPPHGEDFLFSGTNSNLTTSTILKSEYYPYYTKYYLAVP